MIVNRLHLTGFCLNSNDITSARCVQSSCFSGSRLWSFFFYFLLFFLCCLTIISTHNRGKNSVPFEFHAFRYCAKYVVFSVLSFVSATVFIPLMLWRPRDYRNGLLPAWGGRQISKILGLKWEMRGKENIVQNSGCVVLINHQSCLDLLVLSEIWPVMERCTVISKKEIFYLWPFGLASWLWGTIFIDRLNVESAQNTINKTGETIRQKKAKLCMFPEGTRHGGLELLNFKKGAFHVAISSQCPVQPVVVSRYLFLNHEKRIFNPGHIVISILPPIVTEGMTKADLVGLIEKSRSAMQDVYTKSSEELKTKYYNVS